MSLNRALGVSTPIRLCSHVAGVRVRELLFLSGHGPLRKNGVPAFKGTLGIEISPDAGAWIILGATLNAISSANRLLGGLEEIEAVAQVHSPFASTAFHRVRIRLSVALLPLS